MRVFLDTNILLDMLLNRPGLVADSEAVILRCEAAGYQMFIAWHGLATAYYLLKRGRSEADAMVEVDKILSWARVADATDTNARDARALAVWRFRGRSASRICRSQRRRLYHHPQHDGLCQKLHRRAHTTGVCTTIPISLLTSALRQSFEPSQIEDVVIFAADELDSAVAGLDGGEVAVVFGTGIAERELIAVDPVDDAL